ncbi:hypothetical protein [Nostoc sp. GT001]|nr:hypothetical protein [Nostoc sp. GT001]MDM9580139.1 hypothetical protein [Nostoc sp. GT001]
MAYSSESQQMQLISDGAISSTGSDACGGLRLRIHRLWENQNL